MICYIVESYHDLDNNWAAKLKCFTFKLQGICFFSDEDYGLLIARVLIENGLRNIVSKVAFLIGLSA